MSGLKDRLNRLKSSMSPATLQGNMKPEEEISEHVAEAREPQHAWMGGEERWEANAWGTFLVREIRYELNYQHGMYTLGHLTERADALTLQDREETLHHEQMLFFDTETTGLGVGAGNVPFMIGIGYYTESTFIVEQLFIRNPGEETAMLVYLQDKLQNFTHLVSYNGRTFDWPIVRNRFVMNRLTFQLDHLLHLDLLYPSRSLWRNTLPSCRLGIVEEERLGIERGHDVPGSMAPALYFEYLATNNASVLEGVFRHNERDIVTLACLSAHFGGLLKGEVSWERMEAEELYRLGLWYVKYGLESLAAEAVSKLMSLPVNQCLPYYVPLAESYKKLGQEEKALQLWQRYIQLNTKGALQSLEPYIELSMYYEHKRKDFNSALLYAEEALELMTRRLALTRADPKQRAGMKELQKRAERIRRKQYKQAVSSGWKDAVTEEDYYDRQG
ncbi:ribonuclease H-like domain-containing protein [Paenibacillus swuensis]|uniref:ribonuclease H-like domain-containing protein n=1 Tax=Paenibacillus swuensis TaxID=1178515 RepID=UPI000838A016|nr:ribonuclease H-like domain-containing protein [Paenibacillus swuensis]